MDNITHTLAGLMLARSGIDRKVARAAGMMMLAANMPDIDAATFFGGTTFYLQWHRSYPHTLWLAPVMALIPPLLFWLFGKTRMTLWSYAASLLGVLSHLALDWTNVYGIRLLMPYSNRYFHGDMVDIVDPWILAILFLALAAPAMARMVGSEIASRKVKGGPQRGWAWFALIALLSYEGVRYVAHDRALAVMSAHLYNGTIPKKLSAMPRGTMPFTWKGVAQGAAPDTGDFATIVPIDLTEPFDSTAGRIDYSALPVNGTNPTIEAARATHEFRVFADFDQLPFWKATPVEGGTLVELIDLRFGSPQHPGFEASATVDAMGGVHDPKVRFGR